MDKKAAIAVVFENPEFDKIRTLTDENGEPLFCAKVLCNVLEYKRVNDVVYQLVKTLDTVKHRTWVATGPNEDESLSTTLLTATGNLLKSKRVNR